MGTFATAQPEYAAHNVVVFPCDAATKKPSISRPQKIGLPASRQLVLKFPDHDALGLWAGRRNKLTILDVDVPGEEGERLLADLMARHGTTPLIVRSAGGKYHGYYRHGGEPRLIRHGGEPVDVLGNGLVIVPPSRVAAGRYEIIAGHLDDLDRLPRMRGVEPPAAPPAAAEHVIAPVRPLHEGDGRNRELFHRALRMALGADSKEGLLHMVADANLGFADPLPDSELHDIARNVWSYKERGRLMVAGTETPVSILPSEMATLAGNSDAITLLLLLRHAHGWRRGKPFPLANATAGSLGWTVPRYRAARQALLNHFFLRLVHTGGNGPHDPPLAVLL